MKAKNAQLFEKIETLIRNGKLQQAKKELALFSKSKKLLPLERINLAMFHMRLGQGYKAIRCINKELAPNEFPNATIEELCEQATLAHILNQMGAQNYAHRLMAKINEATETRKLVLSSVLPELDRLMGNIYFGAYDYLQALPFYQRVLTQISNPDSYRYKLARIGVADALEGMGRSCEAIEIVSEIIDRTGDDQRLLRAICFQARGEYLFRRGHQGDDALARQDFDRAAELFDPKTDTKDFAFLNKWSGILRMKEGRQDLAQEELEKSREILLSSKNRPTTYFEVFYWLEKIETYRPPLTDKIALRSHPLPSPFCVAAGKRDNRFQNLSNPWLKKILSEVPSPSKDDSWLIENDSMVSISYAQYIKSLPIEKHGDIIDLVSSLLHYADNTLESLTDNQARALLAVVGSGSLGISQWSLIDNVYGQNFYDPISGIERINKTVEQLRKNGFDIFRKNNHYFCNIDPKRSYILPKDLNPKSVYTHFLVNHSQFKRSELEEIYSIKKATANIWVKEWEESGIIQKFGVGKSSYYKFVT